MFDDWPFIRKLNILVWYFGLIIELDPMMDYRPNN